jgi:drug/metabolite transporter (DMT)-like permease
VTGGRLATSTVTTRRRPAPADVALLAVGVVAVSTSAPLIREAAGPALAIAFWRNALAASVLIPLAWARRRRTPRPRYPDDEPSASSRRRAWVLSAVAGVLLGAHFAAWIPSLSLTTVASSVALVATQPIWSAVITAALGRSIGRLTWLGIGVALAGVLIATGVDVGTSWRAARGDGLALMGGILAAGYVHVGARCRTELSTTDYTASCYSVAAAVLLAICLVARQPLVQFGLRGWLCVGAITIGPQLLGHSVFNRVLRTVGPTVVSVAVLAEIVGASLLALWWFGEAPSVTIVPGAACIFAGILLVIRTDPGDFALRAESVSAAA